MSDILYVYGTLRPGGQDTVTIEGQMFDLGWFPGVRLDLPGEVVCEKILIEDWRRTDAYEGYNEKYPEDSLYVRKPFLDGWIYEYNQEFNPVKRVLSGDWLDYTQQERGISGGRFGKST